MCVGAITCDEELCWCKGDTLTTLSFTLKDDNNKASEGVTRKEDENFERKQFQKSIVTV